MLPAKCASRTDLPVLAATMEKRANACTILLRSAPRAAACASPPAAASGSRPAAWLDEPDSKSSRPVARSLESLSATRHGSLPRSPTHSCVAARLTQEKQPSPCVPALSPNRIFFVYTEWATVDRFDNPNRTIFQPILFLGSLPRLLKYPKLSWDELIQ